MSTDIGIYLASANNGVSFYTIAALWAGAYLLSVFGLQIFINAIFSTTYSYWQILRIAVFVTTIASVLNYYRSALNYY